MNKKVRGPNGTAHEKRRLPLLAHKPTAYHRENEVEKEFFQSNTLSRNKPIHSVCVAD